MAHENPISTAFALDPYVQVGSRTVRAAHLDKIVNSRLLIQDIVVASLLSNSLPIFCCWYERPKDT